MVLSGVEYDLLNIWSAAEQEVCLLNENGIGIPSRFRWGLAALFRCTTWVAMYVRVGEVCEAIHYIGRFHVDVCCGLMLMSSNICIHSARLWTSTREKTVVIMYNCTCAIWTGMDMAAQI